MKRKYIFVLIISFVLIITISIGKVNAETSTQGQFPTWKQVRTLISSSINPLINRIQKLEQNQNNPDIQVSVEKVYAQKAPEAQCSDPVCYIFNTKLDISLNGKNIAMFTDTHYNLHFPSRDYAQYIKGDTQQAQFSQGLTDASFPIKGDIDVYYDGAWKTLQVEYKLQQ